MDRIRPFFEKLQLTEVGAVSFESCLPLLPCRAASRIPENAKTVIVCAFPYYVGEASKRNISRYAMIPDYHRVVGDILDEICMELAQIYPHCYQWFADNSPILEVDAAVRAGLGVRGMHSMLINPVYGSYLFLGTIVTDMEVSLQPESSEKVCLRCSACVKSCPAQCIFEKGLEETRCLSAVSQKKGELSEEEAFLIRKGGSLWGCDICQEVCPMNRAISKTPIPAFYQEQKPFLEREDLTKAAVKERAYGFRGVQPLLRNYEILYGKKE